MKPEEVCIGKTKDAVRGHRFTFSNTRNDSWQQRWVQRSRLATSEEDNDQTIAVACQHRERATASDNVVVRMWGEDHHGFALQSRERVRGWLRKACRGKHQGRT